MTSGLHAVSPARIQSKQSVICFATSEPRAEVAFFGQRRKRKDSEFKNEERNMFNRKTLMITAFTTVALFGALMSAACQALPTSISGLAEAPTPNRPKSAFASPTRQPTAAVPETIELRGTFTAPGQAALAFKGSGQITELRVQEGRQVKKGDTLALLDTTAAQLQVQQAQAALAGAQARLHQVRAPAIDADTAAAQAAVDAALKNYERVRAGPTANDLAALKAEADNAKAALDQAQAAYDKIGGATNPYIGMAPQALQLQTTTNNYNAALAAYNNALTHPTAAELAGAWQQVQQAQDALARLQPTSDNIAVAQAAAEQAQAALAEAEQQVEDATLTAPFDGTVLSVGLHVGETVGPGTPILTLADLNHLQVLAGMDQNLLGQIQAGQSVSIVPDAFRDKTVTGKVLRIGWLATSTAGVTSVPVTIDVDSSDVPLRPGLTATVELDIGK
jgi:multidrug resistance efflux pump